MDKRRSTRESLFRLMEKSGSSRRPFEESFHSEKWFAKTLQRLPRSLGEL